MESFVFWRSSGELRLWRRGRPGANPSSRTSPPRSPQSTTVEHINRADDQPKNTFTRSRKCFFFPHYCFKASKHWLTWDSKIEPAWNSSFVYLVFPVNTHLIAARLIKRQRVQMSVAFSWISRGATSQLAAKTKLTNTNWADGGKRQRRGRARDKCDTS